MATRKKTVKSITLPVSETRIIKVKCKAADCIPWKNIKPLQGNYKKRDMTDITKLANLIIKRGIRFPSFVWKNGDDIWAIDTHGRLLSYEYLENNGYEIPSIPVSYIEAKNKTEAKQLLLECDSRFGKVTRESFEEFTQDIEVVEEELSIVFQEVAEEVDDENTEIKKINLSPYNKIHVLLSFEPNKYKLIQGYLESIKNTAGIEYEQSAN